MQLFHKVYWIFQVYKIEMHNNLNNDINELSNYT